MPKEFDYEDFNYDMADILNEEREVKMREEKELEREAKELERQEKELEREANELKRKAEESLQNAKNATKYNFTKEGFNEIVAEIKARGDKPTRERIAEELDISLPTLRNWFKKLEYTIPK
jgi:sugar-specific transcriptional regulator TrmB